MPTSPRPRRSALYVPGSNARAVAKVKEVPADVIIFDLEDSVSPAQKEPAREAVARAVTELATGRREIVVRVNGLDTPWIARDIAAIAAAQPDAILLPKIERIDDIRRARAAITAASPPKAMNLWLMIETPAAILNAAAIAAIASLPPPAITGFVIGTNDLAVELGVPLKPGRAALLPHLSQALLAARAHDLVILDGTFNDLDDRKGLKAECLQGREMGMDGKTVIHPAQVPIANEAYAPDEEELIWAKKIVAAFAEPGNAGVEVMRLSGRMVERLHERQAKRMIAMADAITAMEKETGAATRRRR
ncbi:MAG TPA: CoA ester lyase [Bauldia sp.]|nr:CoA ester lyase [Bauldia sp.]